MYAAFNGITPTAATAIPADFAQATSSESTSSERVMPYFPAIRYGRTGTVLD
jgi:hypothetical protein